MQKGKVYSKRCNGAPLSSRIFSVRKGSKFLFVSSSKTKKPASEIIKIVQEVASSRGCELVIHAGWSFGKRCKANRKILETMRNAVMKPPIKTYVAEFGGHYYIAESQNGTTKVRKCTSQCFWNSSQKQKNLVQRFLSKVEIVSPSRIASKGEYPCFLLICGENNIFNKSNRGGDKYIIPESLSEGFLNGLKRIQDRKWIIFNPSHAPYKGKKLPQRVMDYHRASSSDSSVHRVFTGNNPSQRKPKAYLNRALQWQNRHPKELKLLKEGQASHFFIHLGKIQYRGISYNSLSS